MKSPPKTQNLPPPTCIGLRATYGKRFKVSYEESYRAAYGERATREDPWLQIIPGRRGHVFPWDAGRLAASTDTAGLTAKRLRALPGVEVWQDGSDGVTVLFPPSLLDQVAEMLLLRRRRRVSDQERERLRGLARVHAFRPRGAAVGVRCEERLCVAGGQVDD